MALDPRVLRRFLSAVFLAGALLVAACGGDLAQYDVQRSLSLRAFDQIEAGLGVPDGMDHPKEALQCRDSSERQAWLLTATLTASTDKDDYFRVVELIGGELEASGWIITSPTEGSEIPPAWAVRFRHSAYSDLELAVDNGPFTEGGAGFYIVARSGDRKGC